MHGPRACPFLKSCQKCDRVVRRLGKIPSPAPGEPWMYALGDPWALEDVYRRAGFLNVSVHAVPIPRRFPSAADAIRSMRNSAGDLRELMSRLHDADRELAWAEIEQQLRQFEGPNGFEAPGEVLRGAYWRRDEIKKGKRS